MAEETGGGAANKIAARSSSTLTNDELGSKRVSYSDGTDSSVQPPPSSKPVKKRQKSVDHDNKAAASVKRLLKSGNHVDTPAPTIITSPEINDVLLGKGSDCFNHIGNRRYRILVEINVENYFDSDVTAVKVEDTVGNANTVSAKQDKIIKSIVSSIQGNSPSGRFLLPNVVKGGKVTNNVDVLLWKVASKEEVRRKIHLTFLAAGRFFVKKADIVVEIERRASQVLTESTTDEESRDDSAMQQERRASLGQHAEEDNSEHSTEDSAVDTAKRGEASQEVDAVAGRAAGEQESDSSRNKPSPSTMNLQEGIPMSRHRYDQQMLLSRSSGQAMNYIPRTIKSFISIPVEEFFMPDERLAASSAEVIPHPAAYIMPSNYDVLCGAGQSFFHHIGNRRFRIMIEMNIDRYQVEYEKGDGGEKGKIHALVSEINQSILRCDPPGRFLAMDMTRGWWKRLSPMFALLKIEQTLFECMQMRRAEQNLLAAKQKEQMVMAIEAATRSTLQRHAQEDLLEAAKQKEQLERAIDMAGEVQCGSYIPAKRKKKQESRSSTLTREEANIFFPPVFGDEEKLTKAQEEAKRTLCNSRSRDDPPSITNKPVPPFTTSPTPTTSPSKINLSENESTNDSQVVSEEERKSEQSHISHDRSVLDAVGGMLEISRRGSSSQS